MIDIVIDGNVATLLQTILKRSTAHDRFPISYIEVRKIVNTDHPCIRMVHVDGSGNDKWIWDYQLSGNDFDEGIDEFAEVLTDFWRNKIAEWSKTETTRYWYAIDIPRNFRIKEVKFNGPATVVFWEDGTKTVVKCDPTDKFDPEKGLAMAISKKFLGNNTGKYYDIFKKYIPTGCYMKDTNSKEVVHCGNCVYSDLLLTQEPCYYCNHWSNFIRKGKKND